MQELFLTLEIENAGSWDLAVPSDVPSERLMREIFSSLGLEYFPGKLVVRNRPVDPSATLVSAGVLRGAVVKWLGPDTPLLPRGILRLPSGRDVDLRRLGKVTVTIGRPGPKGRPDIDLTKEAGGETVSRHHAILHAEGDAWRVEGFSETNPTALNEVRLSIRETARLRPGDIIALGELELRFDE